MAGIYGILGVQDGDTSYVNTIGQRQVFDAANQFLEMHTADLERAMAVFIEADTEDYTERYYLPSGGRMQRRGGQAQSAAIKAINSWDVAFPLEDFGAQIAWTDIAVAKMKLPMLQRHLDSVRIIDTNTMRFEILKSIFNSGSRTFIDDDHGSLTIKPLANGDTDTYPPVLGTETDATENHYLESNYAASAISDTNNPYITMRDELEEHFGEGEIVAWIHPDQVPKTEALTDFDPVNDRHIRPGANTDQVDGGPVVPGEIIGRCNGIWIAKWRWIPTGWMYAQDLMALPPLKRRVDPAETGLQPGLQLVSRSVDYPFEQSHYRNRAGFGVGNRLNGVVMELGTGGTYTIPTIYQ